ncbi:CatA-like O-acetyltransferase [Maridesulfovibrio sp.]|uniref:CatA-like O-acetyltransferase n=1 Tax=Maridesulfovibrio sp. TaxID=2795000 RepID=UPI002A18C234|nr:CatA-like O-acetyltransferase [Maridesulfovibrio sp.]
MEKIDLQTWERTEHFNFFQSMKKCNYDTTVQQDVTALCAYRRQAKDSGRELRLSDIIYFFAMKAVNSIPELRTRVVDGNPVIYDIIHPAFTYIPKDRKLHANVLCRYSPDFREQAANFDNARHESDISPTLTPRGGDRQNLIYFSIVAGVPFTSASNPWGDCSCDSVPRILFGQIHENDSGKKMLPVSIELLHSLADGQHLAGFYDLFGQMCASPAEFLD